MRMPAGFSLMETVIALGVLAVSVPLVFLALEKGGQSGMASTTDSRCGRMIETCLEEVRASREGRARWFSDSHPGDPIPPDGEFWGMAFSNDGRLIGKISAEQWTAGVSRLDGHAVRYLAGIDSEALQSTGLPEMRKVRMTVEQPAVAPAGKRDRSEFLTLVP